MQLNFCILLHFPSGYWTAYPCIHFSLPSHGPVEGVLGKLKALLVSYTALLHVLYEMYVLRTIQSHYQWPYSYFIAILFTSTMGTGWLLLTSSPFTSLLVVQWEVVLIYIHGDLV